MVMVLVGMAPATQRRGRSACEGKIPRLQKIQTNGIDAGWGGGSPMAGSAMGVCYVLVSGHCG